MKKYGPAVFGLMALVILLSLNFGETGLPALGEGSSAAVGDADCDASVDAVDALQILRAASDPAAANDCATGADTDCDGSLDAVDALRVLRHSAGFAVEYRRGCGLIGGDEIPSP